MAIFNFTALSANGDQQEGSREATNKDELKQSLAVEGMQMLSAEEEASNGISFLTPSVKKKDLVYLTGQLAIMIETGINLAAALESVVEQVESVRLKVALRDLLIAQVTHGEPMGKSELDGALAGLTMHHIASYHPSSTL